MKDFIEYLVKSMVKNPEDVRVEEEAREGYTVYTIHVNDDDMGIVIGKAGKNIRAIRNLAKAKAIRDNVHVKIDLYDPERDNANI